MVALLAVHSSLHCFAVFTFAAGLGAAFLGGLGAAVVAGLGAAVGPAVVAGFGAAAGAAVACPRHSVTNTFLVFPLDWIVDLLAVHSSLHCLAVFC